MMVVRLLFAHCPVLLLFALALPSSLPAQTQKFEGLTIRNIAFNPVDQPLDAEELHEILPLQMNTPFAMTTVRAAIDRLYATGRYSDIQVDVQPYREGVAVTFITRPSWFIGDVQVTGNLKSPPNIGQLENAGDLGLGQPYTDDKVEEGISEMKRLLENNGLFVNSIEPEFDWETNANVQQVNIRFKVQATERARLLAPRLTGDLKADLKVLENRMGLRRWLVGTWKPMTQSRVRQSVDRLRSYYQKEDRLRSTVTLEGVHYQPESKGAEISLRIDAGPKIELRPIGAKVSRNTLRKLVPIYQEHAVDNDLLSEGARNLRDYFQSKGFFEAEVAFKSQNVINDKATIDFLINTGERHRLVHIGINGNRYFSTENIRERMFLQTATFLTFRYGRYSGNLLKRDEESIRNLYLSNGFLDVQVAAATSDRYLGKSGDIAVFFNITEGPQYFVHELAVEGIEHLDKDKIMASLSSVPGQPYSEFNVAVDRDAILARYNENGFPDAMFEWKPTPAAEPHQMDLRFVIKEGRQQFVRAVLISGNKVTRSKLINRQISLSPGDPLSPREITDIQRRLYDLGVFAKVDAAIQDPDGATDRKYVLYNVDEARRYSTALGFGAELGRIGGSGLAGAPAGSTGFSPRVSYDITRNNLWGLGHSLSLRTRASTLDRRGVLNYSWPRFGSNDNLSVAFTGLYEFSRRIQTFTYQRAEVSAQLVHRLDKAWTAFYRFSYRSVNLKDLNISQYLVPAIAREVRVGIPSLSLVQDKRDDALDPHRGVYNTFDFGVAERIFGSEVNYVRFLVRNATYHPIGKRTVLARSTQFGNIFGYRYSPNDNNEIPLAERFFGGGGTSNRAFPENQAGPRDLITGFPLGGTTQFFNQTELRFPLIGANVGGVIFHDMGNIYSKLSDFSFRSRQRGLDDFNYLVHSIGFGIRYRTPVGPVRFDIGYAINPPSFNGLDPNLSSQELANLGPQPCTTDPSKCQQRSLGHFRWFFSIGQTF